MAKIINAAGTEIDFDAAANLMDHDIIADLDYGDGLTEQSFFNDYCIMHRTRFGEEFEPNKEHPVW